MVSECSQAQRSCTLLDVREYSLLSELQCVMLAVPNAFHAELLALSWRYCALLQVNQKVSKTAHIKELNQEIDRLKAELFCTREKNGVYMPAELFAQREQV